MCAEHERCTEVNRCFFLIGMFNFHKKLRWKCIWFHCSRESTWKCFQVENYKLVQYGKVYSTNIHILQRTETQCDPLSFI